MPKKISFILSIEEETIHELRRVWQGSSLSWPSFLEAVLRVGVDQFDGITQAAWATQKEKEKEVINLHELFPEKEGAEQ